MEIGKIFLKYRKKNNYTMFEMGKKIGYSKSQINNIEKTNKASPKAIMKFLEKVKDIEEKEKKFLEIEIKKNTTKNDNMVSIMSILDKLDKLEEENKKLKKQIEIYSSNLSNDYFKKRKVGTFNTNLETRTFLITKIWELNDLVFKQWSEVKLLISINGNDENLKIEKGIKSVSDSLKKISDEMNYEISKNKNKLKTIILED